MRFGSIVAAGRSQIRYCAIVRMQAFFSSPRACQGSPFRRPPKAAALRAVLDKLSGMKNAPPCKRWIKLDRVHQIASRSSAQGRTFEGLSGKGRLRTVAQVRYGRRTEWRAKIG